WIYHMFAALAILAVVGLVGAWRRRTIDRLHLVLLSAFYVLFCAGVSYHVLITFLANGISSSAGWYLCSVIVPEVVLAIAGLRALLGWKAIGATATAFALLDLYGMLFVALPYWAGMIGHRPNGFLEAFHVDQFSAVLFQRSAFLGLGAVALLFCLYFWGTA